jgi:hypothetical protein
MKKSVSIFALVLFMSLGLVASNSFASGTRERGGFMMLDSSNLVGAPVKDSHGELMGIVNGVMIDSGGYAFAILNHGDYDLTGETGINTPVPFQELRIVKARGGARRCCSQNGYGTPGFRALSESAQNGQSSG